MHHRLVEHRVMKIAPHVIDSALFLSGLFMMLVWLSSGQPRLWLLFKMTALLFYIGFGLLMLRWGSTERRRWLGFLMGLILYGYIVGVAHSKSIISFFSYAS